MFCEQYFDKYISQIACIFSIYKFVTLEYKTSHMGQQTYIFIKMFT